MNTTQQELALIDDDTSPKEEDATFVERGIIVRSLWSIAWFAFIFLATELAIGLIVGISVTDGQMTFEEGYQAGVAAEEAITPKYWWAILLGQILLWLVLLIWGKLPGTTKTRRRA